MARPSSKPPRGKTWQYVCLGILLAIFVIDFGLITQQVIEFSFAASGPPGPPFFLRDTAPIVGALVTKEAKDAGLRVGDRVLEIEGAVVTGRLALRDAVRRVGAGGTLHVVVQTGSEAPRAMALALEATPPMSPKDAFVNVVLAVAMPWFCTALGFWVVFLRPWDRLAWILLGLLGSFGMMVLGSDPTLFPPPLRLPHLIFSELGRVSWPVWMLLFGLYFPEPIGFERRIRWVKWVVIVAMAYDGTIDVLRRWGWLSWYPLAQAVIPISNAQQLPMTIISMSAVGLFFVCNGRRFGSDQNLDTRRRVKLLYFGATISLTPVFLLTIISLFLRKQWSQVAPGWVNMVAGLLLPLFPLTLAYLIVVHRAFDVRVVVRRGLQYALARGSVRFLQVLVTVGIVIVVVRASSADLNTWLKVGLIGAGAAVVILMRRTGEKLRGWTDRKFFRESYRAELVLSELGQKVRRMVERRPLLETVAKTVSDSLHVARVALLVEGDGRYTPAYALGYDAPPPAFPKDASTVRRLRERNEPLTVYFDDPRSWVNRDGEVTDEERERLESLDCQLLLPLAVQERLLGFVSLGAKQSEEPFTKGDIQLLESVAAQTGLALENSRLAEEISSEVAQRERLNRELEIARDVQQRLLPRKLPVVPGFDYAGACRPAQSVGGDYYDFVSTPKGEFGIAIGDISGKGVPAALLMAVLQASLRGQVIGAPEDLAQLMANMNRLIYDASPSNRFATFIYAQYDPATRRLAFVNAGHNPPLLMRAGGEIERLMPSGPALGLTPQASYRQSSFALESGDLLVAFTDGISEARNAAGEEFEEDRLIETVRTCAWLPPAEIVQRVIAAVDTFAAGAPQHDDITLAVARAGGAER
jgi:phosphoserine phosphatase RsbU/P